MKNTLLVLVTILTVHSAWAQLELPPKNRVISIPVERHGKDLRAPWTGGMNAPQFSFADLDNDGTKDLFVFDRVGNKVLTYLNHGNGSDTTFYYAPQFEELFPADLVNWAVLRDYNNDGTPDIFTQTNLGIRVFKGSRQNNVLHFDLVSPLVLYWDGTYNVNIWINVDDMPLFTDVNRDGDIDVLTFGIFNGSMVEYYENQTMEHGADSLYAIDSFKYEVATSCWGRFAESSTNNSIAMNLSCKGGGGTVINEGGSRHIGSTIYSFDDGNDHDVDLLIGDISFNNLVFVDNCGDSSFANVCKWDSVFPACNVPVALPIFPAAYGADANNDGFEDLLVAPNARTGARDVKNVMYYKNVNNQLCNFEFQNDSFLVDQSMDLGTDSKPVFFDINGDGLKDIVVGNYGYFRPFTTYRSQIAVYLNTGTQTRPEFTMSTEDFNNFDSIGLVSMFPAFGDLDGDNKADLLIGELNGFTHFFKNTGSTQAAFSPNPTAANFFAIDIGQNSAPFIYDVNGDSLNDLIIGKKDGKLSYYWNMGTKTSPQFNRDSVNANFGKVNVTKFGFTEGYSTPYIRKDSANNMLLYVGCDRGFIFEYVIDPTKLRSGTFPLIDTNIIKHRIGTRSAVSVADITNDGKMEYIIGNSRGGLMMYSDAVLDAGITLGQINLQGFDISMRIFPNPAKEFFTCVLSEGEFAKPVIELYNVIGERVAVEVNAGANSIRINTAHLGEGMYFIRVTDNGKAFSGKVLIGR